VIRKKGAVRDGARVWRSRRLIRRRCANVRRGSAFAYKKIAARDAVPALSRISGLALVVFFPGEYLPYVPGQVAVPGTQFGD